MPGRQAKVERKGGEQEEGHCRTDSSNFSSWKPRVGRYKYYAMDLAVKRHLRIYLWFYPVIFSSVFLLIIIKFKPAFHHLQSLVPGIKLILLKTSPLRIIFKYSFAEEKNILQKYIWKNQI